MKKIESKKKQLFPSKTKSTAIHKLINEHDRAIEISPVHVLVISLLFIANVFLLHLYSKFGPSSSPYQVLFAIVIVLISILAGVSMNKK